MINERLDRLLARPALRMHAGVDHKPRSAEALALQIAQAAKGIAIVVAKLVDQLFGVKRPTFDEVVEPFGSPGWRKATSRFCTTRCYHDAFVAMTSSAAIGQVKSRLDPGRRFK